MIISVHVLGLKRNKMKEKKRGRESSAVITPYLLLPYMHSYTYRRTCTYIYLFPIHARNILASYRYCLCLSYVSFIVLPSVKSPCARRIDHLNLNSH